MNADLWRFLSGRVPGGVAALPLAIAVFAGAWYFIWSSTKFWDRRRFWQVTFRGWTVLIVLYLAVWTWHKPPRIPSRVVILVQPPPYSAAGSSPNGSLAWIAPALADHLAERLRLASGPISVQTADFVPVLRRFERDDDARQSLASKLWAKWLVVAESDDRDSGRLTVWKRSGSAYHRAKEFAWPDSGFAQWADSLVGQCLRAMGVTSPTPRRDVYTAPDQDYRRLWQARFRAGRSGGEGDSLFEQLLEMHPRWLKLRKVFAEHLFETRPGLAAQPIQDNLTAALREDSTDVEALLLLGRNFLYHRRWDEAEAAFKLALATDSFDPRVFFYLSRLDQSRYGDLTLKSRRRLLQRTLELAPGYESARLELARLHWTVQEQPTVIKLLDEGLDIHPQSVPLLLWYSAKEIEMGHYAQAVEHCRRILALEPGHPEALYNMGIAYIWLKEPDTAIALLDSSYRMKGPADALYYIGIANLEKHAWDEAVLSFQRRMAVPQSLDDRVAVEARKMVNKVRFWVAQGDTLESDWLKRK